MRISTALGGGSSSVFSKQFALGMLKWSASSTIATLRRPKNGRRPNAMAQALLVAMLFVADEQFNRQHRLVSRQPDNFQIRMIAGCKHAARLALAARRQPLLRRFRAQQRVSQLNREPPLANARRPHEQVSARQPPGGQRPAKLLHYRRRAQLFLATCRIYRQVGVFT